MQEQSFVRSNAQDITINNDPEAYLIYYEKRYTFYAKIQETQSLIQSFVPS
jgi:hypothetical protein